MKKDKGKKKGKNKQKMIKNMKNKNKRIKNKNKLEVTSKGTTKKTMRTWEK